jgi:hypothetical protein
VWKAQEESWQNLPEIRDRGPRVPNRRVGDGYHQVESPISGATDPWVVRLQTARPSPLVHKFPQDAYHLGVGLVLVLGLNQIWVGMIQTRAAGLSSRM